MFFRGFQDLVFDQGFKSTFGTKYFFQTGLFFRQFFLLAAYLLGLGSANHPLVLVAAPAVAWYYRESRLVPVTVVLALVAGACASDVTEPDEFRSVQQELADVEARLTEVIAERDALAAGPSTDRYEKASKNQALLVEMMVYVVAATTTLSTVFVRRDITD